MKTHTIQVTLEDILLGAPCTEFGSPLQHAIRREFPHLVSIRVNSTMVECYNLADEILVAVLPHEAIFFERRFQLGGKMKPITFSMKAPE